jgi:hypothetical protein
MGVNIDSMDVGGVEDGDFFVKFRVRDRKSDFKWVLVAVYGAAQPEFKESFLTDYGVSASLQRGKSSVVHRRGFQYHSK